MEQEPLRPKKKRAKRQANKSTVGLSTQPLDEPIELARPLTETVEIIEEPKPKKAQPKSDFSKVTVDRVNAGSMIYTSPPFLIALSPDGGIVVTSPDGDKQSFGKKQILSSK
jgi:hypothetical protein